MTGTTPDLPPRPAGVPEELESAASGFRTVATELTAMSDHLRNSAQRLADQYLSLESETAQAFLRSSTEIRSIMTAAVDVVDRFRTICDSWAPEMRAAQAEYDSAARDYEEALVGYRLAQAEVAEARRVDALPGRRRFVETGGFDAGMLAQWRLVDAQRLVDDAVARANAARDRADEAARRAARDFSNIPSLRWNGLDLSRPGLAVEFLAEAADTLDRVPSVDLNPRISRAFDALGFVLTYFEEGAANSNPDLHPEEQVAWTVSDTVVRTGTSWAAGTAAGTAAGIGTVALWAAAGGVVGPVGVAAGAVAGLIAGVVVGNATDDAVSERLDAAHARDGGYLDVDDFEDPVRSRYPDSAYDFQDRPVQDSWTGPIPGAEPIPPATFDDDDR